MHGLELAEILGERDEMDGGSFVELEKVWVVVVPLPTQRQQLALEHGVGADHFLTWGVDQHLAPGVGALHGIRPVHESNDAVLENPNPRHV